MSVIDDLIFRFWENSLEAACPQQAGRTQAGTRTADASHDAYLELSASDEGRAALPTLLEHPDLVIQIDVAGQLWPDLVAVPALRRWADADDVRGKQAAFVLKDAGRRRDGRAERR